MTRRPHRPKPQCLIAVRPHPYLTNFAALEFDGGDGTARSLALALRRAAVTVETRWPNGFPEPQEGPSYESDLRQGVSRESAGTAPD